MLGFPILYLKGVRIMMFQLSGFYYKGCSKGYYTVLLGFRACGSGYEVVDFGFQDWSFRVTTCRDKI